MCKIIKGEEATDLMNATLEEIRLRKLLDMLKQLKRIVEHNNRIVPDALDRMIGTFSKELQAINDVRSNGNG